MQCAMRSSPLRSPLRILGTMQVLEQDKSSTIVLGGQEGSLEHKLGGRADSRDNSPSVSENLHLLTNIIGSIKTVCSFIIMLYLHY